MKNIINYYYNLNLLDVYEVNDKFYFNINNIDYLFIIFDRPFEDAVPIYNLYLELKRRNIQVNDIITNKDNQIITNVNGIFYVLIADKTKNRSINMNDILYLQNNTLNIINEKKLYRTDWIKMWKEKIDYYETQMNEIARKFKKISDNIDFYIGLGENAISYLVNSNVKIENTCISHKRIDINKGAFDFYGPVNFIIDSRVRDFAEYTKNLFFLDKIDFDLFRYYLDYMNFSKDEYVLLIARLLFPTYYFDLYDNIINYNLDEDLINNIVSKTNNYILFLKKVMIYIVYNKRINIPFIEWIIKEAN